MLRPTVCLAAACLGLAAASAWAKEVSFEVTPSSRGPHTALDAAARIAAGNRGDTLRITFRAGVYRIDQPLVIDLRHVPSNGHLVIAAAPGEKVVVSGGRSIDQWEVTEDGTWVAKLPEVASGQWAFRELYVGGERRTRARHPNQGYLRVVEAFPDKRTGFTFTPGDLPASWVGGGELVFLHDWSLSRIPVASVDPAAHRLQTAFPIGSGSDHFRIDHFESHPRYFVEDRPEFLDAPGEWYLDRDQGTLTYWPLPGENPETTEVIAPRAEALLVVRGTEDEPVRNVHIQGIRFQHCHWPLPPQGYAASQATRHDPRGESGSRRFIPAAVTLELAEDCSIEQCEFTQLGTSGVEIGRQTRRCRLVDSVVDDVAGNGVNLGEDTARQVNGDAWWRSAPDQAASELLVAHNRITHCGREFYGAVAVWAGLVRQVEISHNEIAHHPYTGVSIGWMWNPRETPAAENLVSDNHIHHVMQILSDGGGIYTLGRQPGTRLVRNRIHHVPLNAGRAESNGMFLDEGSDQIVIEGNVIYETIRSPLRFHQARSMTVRNNTLVLPDADTPPLRFNSTDPKTIATENNTIITLKEFDPQAIPAPETGPRPEVSETAR